MTPEKRETAIKWLTEEVRSLRMAPKINGCGPENWADQLEVMETCLEAVMWNGDEPLTLEQLRKKVGQPVVIKYSYGGPNTVAIVDVRYVPHLGADKIRLVFPDGYITVNEKDYGTYFTTYAYPPANIGLLARAEEAEARAEKAERERDAAVSDLEYIMAYNKDTCQFCKNGQCYIRGGTKPCLPKWRGQKED